MRKLNYVKIGMLFLIVVLILLPTEVTFAADENSGGNGREANYQQIRIPEIKKFERNGFVSIEWGGVFWK